MTLFDKYENLPRAKIERIVKRLRKQRRLEMLKIDFKTAREKFKFDEVHHLYSFCVDNELYIFDTQAEKSAWVQQNT